MTITLALPSKGRLKEQALEIFATAGFAVSLPGDDRKYRARILGRPDIEVGFFSASEIAGEIGRGTVDLGVTGEDLLREQISDLDGRIELLRALGFGRADLVVAVPRGWLDVDSMADLEEVAHMHLIRTGRRLRVATKYIVQTRAFFAKAGVADYRIVE